MPKRLVTTYKYLTVSGLTILAYVVGYFLFGPDPVRIVFGSLLIGSLVTVTFILTGPAMKALKRGVSDGGDNILISQWGIFGLLLGYFVWVQFITSMRVRAQTPEEAAAVSAYFRDLPVGGLFTTLFFLTAAYTILAPINTKVEIEKLSIRKWLFAVSIGSAIAAILGTLSFLGIVNYFRAG